MVDSGRAGHRVAGVARGGARPGRMAQGASPLPAGRADYGRARLGLRDSFACESPSRPANQARIGVAYLWFVDLDGRTLTASKLVDGRWLEIGIFGEKDVIRAEPFEAVALSMSEWWM